MYVLILSNLISSVAYFRLIISTGDQMNTGDAVPDFALNSYFSVFISKQRSAW